ncbi:MAG: hypothetical protein RL722_1470 [Pseudomonadota bacterium]|jgi:chemotaxis protein methyltransferase CheR
MSISAHSFAAITEAFHRSSGIRLTEAKRQLVVGRLQKLARERGMQDLDSYVSSVVQGEDPAELTRVVDKLTTNETYFFREPEHFAFLGQLLDQGQLGAGGLAGEGLRLWSAASSSGEEAYSIAMLLANRLGLKAPWQIVGTDLSTAMVATAQRALYPLNRAELVPQADLKRWCLRGEGDYQGQLLVKRELRQKVSFDVANLMEDLSSLGRFDLIFLRNVLIYFDPDTKARIVERVGACLRPGGWLFTGHAESINFQPLQLRGGPPGAAPGRLVLVQPAIYQRV